LGEPAKWMPVADHLEVFAVIRLVPSIRSSVLAALGAPRTYG